MTWHKALPPGFDADEENNPVMERISIAHPFTAGITGISRVSKGVNALVSNAYHLFDPTRKRVGY